MSNRLLLVGLGLLALMALLIRDFARDIVVVPLLYVVWIAGLILRSAPQVLLWSLLVLIALVAAVRSLAPSGLKGRPRRAAPQRGRLDEWVGLIDLARTDALSRWRLAQRLEEIAIQTLAEYEREPVDQARRRLRNGKANMPPELQRYLTARMPTGRRSAVRSEGAPSNNPLDLDPEQVVRFLEEKTERGSEF